MFAYCLPGRKLSLSLIFLCLASVLFGQTIFQPFDVPAVPLGNDGAAINVGVKFKSTQDGFITALRYYKGAGTTGTHKGQLWTAGGSLIDSVTFTSETASGWQEAAFANPVAITAGITYIAACHSPSGDYAYSNPYFTQAVVNGPLRALASGEEGPNGLYIYSSTATFPSNSFQSINYWVDVVFSTTVGPDVEPPQVSAVQPANGANAVSTGTTVRAVFNEVIDANTINASNFVLRDATNNIIPAALSYTPGNNTAVLTPLSPLEISTTYTATIKGGNAGVTDIAGNPLAADYNWSFTTGSILSPTQGHGGPILVLSHASNPFSRYAVEILRAEGLNEFLARDISTVTAADLDSYDVIVLGEMPVTIDQALMLKYWVEAGGVLVAFRPVNMLAPLFGLSSINGTLANKYLLVNTASGPGVGIVNQTIQFHGEANLHTLSGATAIATLYSDATIATSNPAVTTFNVGSNGGKAIAFTYDLARSVVYTRQGNPEWAGQERDGQLPIRSDDLFFGLPENSGNDWIDLNKVAIPQADEQQRLLANIIIQGNAHQKPLPRLWYLPKGLKAAVVMTGDDHGNNGTEGRFNAYLAQGPNSPLDVQEWNAIRGTSYIYPNTPISDAQIATFESQGFEIALHPTTNCTNYTEASLHAAMSSQLGVFSSIFPSVSPQTSNRTHCLVWSDWASHAKVQANNGIRLDVNYYYWPGSWVQNRPGMFTGSGMPMRFADADGSLIDCYQVTTQMTDESGLDLSSFCDQLLDKAIGPEGYYGTFCANMHTDSVNHNGSSAIIASAKARKIPVISSRQLLTWLDGRNNSHFSSMSWNNNNLQFNLTGAPGAYNLKGMVPKYNGGAMLVSITIDGVAAAFNAEVIKGIEYAFFNVASGTHTYVATYAQAPLITVQPVDETICDTREINFISQATGNPAPAVQWQESTDGVNWNDLQGATAGTLTFVVNASHNGRQYRATWTNSSGTATSNAVTLTVKTMPVLSSTLNPPPIESGTVFSYTPTSATPGTSFSWNREVVTGISNPPNNGVGMINEVLVNTTNAPVTVKYVYKVSADGCFNSQHVFVKVMPAAAAGCNFTTSIAANFNGVTIGSGRHLWFSSLFRLSNAGTGPVNVRVTNSTITYMLNGAPVTHSVPNARIRFTPGASGSSTSFVNGEWVTQVPLNTSANVFLTGLAYLVPRSIPGGLRNVVWNADVEIDKEDAVFEWKWTAGVYTNFSSHANLNVKPVDGLLNILNPLLGIASAGTPLNHILNVISGAMGYGLLNVTSTYSASKRGICNTGAAIVGTVSGRQAADQALVNERTAPAMFDARAMPNPTTGTFNLVITGNGEAPVSVRVLDMFGKVMMRNDRVSAGTLRFGQGWGAGTYFAEVIHGSEKKIIKLVKVN